MVQIVVISTKTKCSFFSNLSIRILEFSRGKSCSTTVYITSPFFDEFENVEERLVTNKKTGEELSLSINNNGYEEEDRGVVYRGICTVGCMIDISRRKLIVSKTAKKNAK